MNHALYTNGHHHHDILTLTAHGNNNGNHIIFLGANHRRWRLIQCSMWTILSAVFVIHIITEKRTTYYTTPTTTTPTTSQQQPNILLQEKTTKTATTTKTIQQTLNDEEQHQQQLQQQVLLYHPDLSFTLTSEQSEERLDFMNRKRQRKKQTKKEDKDVSNKKNNNNKDSSTTSLSSSSSSSATTRNKNDHDRLKNNDNVQGNEDDNDDDDDNNNDDKEDNDDDDDDDDNGDDRTNSRNEKEEEEEDNDDNGNDDDNDEDDNDKHNSDDDDDDNQYGTRSSSSRNNSKRTYNNDNDDNDNDHDAIDSQSDAVQQQGLVPPPLCNRSQIINGKWIHEDLDKPPYITPTVHLRCYSHDTYYTTNHNKKYRTWKWYPTAKKKNQCHMESFFHKKQFCSLLSNAIVSIIGDSLSWEHYSSLIQLNNIKTKQGYQHQSRELNTNIYQAVCNGYTKIVYRRDDKLHNITNSIENDFPIVLILNRGAHYVPDDELITDIRYNINELKTIWISKCITLQIKCHLFWRTSVPGHPGCAIHVNNSISKTGYGNAYLQPINNRYQMETLIGNLSNYNERTMNYHWYDYQHQNEVVIDLLYTELHDIVQQYPNSIQFEIIDAYYLNVLRPDEHRAHQEDCLHNCYPGKMDVYNTLLVHYLKKQRNEHDIQQLSNLFLNNNNNKNNNNNNKVSLWIVNETTVFLPEATEQARQIREGKQQHQ